MENQKISLLSSMIESRIHNHVKHRLYFSDLILAFTTLIQELDFTINLFFVDFINCSIDYNLFH